MRLRERYRYDREREASLVYRTTDRQHPGVAALYRRGDVLLGGEGTPLRPPDPRAPRRKDPPAGPRAPPRPPAGGRAAGGGSFPGPARRPPAPSPATTTPLKNC